MCRLGVMQQREHAKQLAQDMDPMIARELEEALAPPSVIAGSEVRRRDWGLTGPRELCLQDAQPAR